jgi:hypothetical protein
MNGNHHVTNDNNLNHRIMDDSSGNQNTMKDSNRNQDIGLLNLRSSILLLIVEEARLRYGRNITIFDPYMR